MRTNIKGVILAGGKGTRLGELTRATNKSLLPVGPYPMIYHPIKKMVEACVDDIMVISGPEHIGDIIEALGSGARLECNMTYRVQEYAGGIAHALGLASGFCKDEYSLVILGDNIFQDTLNLAGYDNCAKIFLKEVTDPNRYGIVEFDGNTLVRIIEKPQLAPSRMAVTGIYVYPPDVFRIIKTLKPSSRGEYEITDVNNYYIKEHRMDWTDLRGYWIDAGTHESLHQINRLIAGE